MDVKNEAQQQGLEESLTAEVTKMKATVEKVTEEKNAYAREARDLTVQVDKLQASINVKDISFSKVV